MGNGLTRREGRKERRWEKEGLMHGKRWEWEKDGETIKQRIMKKGSWENEGREMGGSRIDGRKD